jgi:UDP-N-acetylenolpyruvoylglucosamine reductase
MDREGRIFEKSREEIAVEYRCCKLFIDNLALGALVGGPRETMEAIDRRRKECSARRWSTQPAAASAGCIFKNPASVPAGRLIQELGLKGTRIGDAVVSDVHANFIVNAGRANARDVLALIELVRERARTERGIELQTEVEIVGSSEE